MRIGGLQKFSLIDYPGKTAAVIFTQGCHFRCPFCFNPTLVLPERFGPVLPEEEVLAFLRKRQGQLEGVVVSGGEPTIQEDLPEFFRKIHALGYPLKLDTNGSNPKMLQTLIESGRVDYIAMDIKAPLRKYNLLAGIDVDLREIQKSIDLIIHSGISHEFRTTVVPSLLSQEDLQEIARWLEGEPYHLQPFIDQEDILDKNLLDKERKLLCQSKN